MYDIDHLNCRLYGTANTLYILVLTMKNATRLRVLIVTTSYYHVRILVRFK